jgi:hypothetical protein
VSPVITNVAGEEGRSADGQKNRENITSFICTEGGCLRRRGAAVAGEEHSAFEQNNIIRGDVPSNNLRLGGNSEVSPDVTYQHLQK